MRPDGKPEGLRQSMSWLHTWTGLLLGWLLYAVFFTGTLSYFRDEINVWMQPETHRSTPGADTPGTALAAMAGIAPHAVLWRVDLPGERRTAVEVAWRDRGAPAGRAGFKRAELDASTGAVIQARETRGADFLYRFHFELHGVPRAWGRWIVCIATFLMFVAIVSGVVTHKKIFTDFFTFRPRKGQRSWLDAHNATAVLALPFHVMITFSGLLLFMYMLAPWAISALYGDDHQRYFQERRAAVQPAQTLPAAPGAGAPGPRDLAPIGPMVAQAQRAWAGRPVGSIEVSEPGGPSPVVTLVEDGATTLLAGRGARRMRFDGHSGTAVDPAAGAAPESSAWPGATYNTLTALHLGHFAGPALRWLLFLSGVVGTLMVATGMVMWVVKRLPERRKRGATLFGHRVVEVLNVGTIGGLSVATASYFWLNRFIPADLPARGGWEIRGFFAIWTLCFLHGALRSHRKAWQEQLAAAALLFVLLVALNPLTGGIALPQAVFQGRWLLAGFDIGALLVGLAHLAAVFHLAKRARQKPHAAGTAGRAAPAPAARTAVDSAASEARA